MVDIKALREKYRNDPDVLYIHPKTGLLKVKVYFPKKDVFTVLWFRPEHYERTLKRYGYWYRGKRIGGKLKLEKYILASRAPKKPDKIIESYKVYHVNVNTGEEKEEVVTKILNTKGKVLDVKKRIVRYKPPKRRVIRRPKPKIVKPISIKKPSKPKSKQAIIRAKQNLSSPLPQPKPIKNETVRIQKDEPKDEIKKFDYKKLALYGLGAFIALKILKR